MHQFQPAPHVLPNLRGKTAIITGSGRGIGAATATLFNNHGANVVITDLPSLRAQAESLIQSLPNPPQAIFVPANVVIWKDMVQVFKTAVKAFGRVDIVVANAALMESRPVLETEVDENGDPVESVEANRVMDVNLKGVFNSESHTFSMLDQDVLPSNPSPFNELSSE
jgi:NAD(P)-dependent dehydrogenase (short-subunit alcohol dehydrogenase family)